MGCKKIETVLRAHVSVIMGSGVYSHMREGQGWPSLGTAKGSNSNTESSIILSLGRGWGRVGVSCFSMSQLESLRVRAYGSSRFSSVVLPCQRGRVWKLQERMQLAELGSSIDPNPLLKSRDLGRSERI